MDQSVTVGRIVHFLVPGDKEPTAAIVTKVVDAEKRIVHLTLMKPGAANYAWDVAHADTLTALKWSWPSRNG